MLSVSTTSFMLTPCGLRGVVWPWFICWFRRYIYRLLAYIFCFPTYVFFFTLSLSSSIQRHQNRFCTPTTSWQNRAHNLWRSKAWRTYSQTDRQKTQRFWPLRWGWNLAWRRGPSPCQISPPISATCHPAGEKPQNLSKLNTGALCFAQCCQLWFFCHVICYGWLEMSQLGTVFLRLVV